MKSEKIIILLLVILSIGGLAWSAVSFFSAGKSASQIKNSPENFARYTADELTDKCQTPEGYTEQEWQEHMSHHPDRYSDCLAALPAEALEAFETIESEDLAIMLKNKNFLLIDVHVPEQAHIPGTDNFLPFDQIKNQILSLQTDKNYPIVLYCRSGSMSQQAAKDLTDLGYTNVYHLAGGLDNWEKQGYPVENIKLE